MNQSASVVPLYAVYGTAAVGLTVWLARTLFRNGRTFLADVFEDRPDLAAAVNHLLVVGFFMLNLGYALLLLRPAAATDGAAMAEMLVNRLGLLLVSLGVIHFVNMALFWRIRRRAVLDNAPPPVPAQVVYRQNPVDPNWEAFGA